jgi:intermembrane space import and assembly protein 40
MVKPPCGDTFKAAFSCFVYSKQEPKGADCIQQFREMQECFQAHPEIYAKMAGEDEEERGERENVEALEANRE